MEERERSEVSENEKIEKGTAIIALIIAIVQIAIGIWLFRIMRQNGYTPLFCTYHCNY